MASSKCSIAGCKRTFDTLCEHCQSQVCTKHYIEHVKEANQQLASFSDNLNAMVDFCQQKHPLQDAFRQLEQWRDENHRRIDQIYEDKRQQIQVVVEERMETQMKKLRELSAEVKELIDEGDASFKQISHIKKSIEECQAQCERFQDPYFHIPSEKSIDVETGPAMTTPARANVLFEGEGRLLSPQHQAHLNEWIGINELRWTLIYKATRDGFESTRFHQCCDHSGPTITVVESNNGGYLFGGYTSASWNSLRDYIGDLNNPFLFTLTNPHGIVPTNYPIRRISHAIFGKTDCGPTFGAGPDLHVSSSSDKNKKSTINFPHSYRDTTNRGPLTFTGGHHFQSSEIEVYRLSTNSN